jgi:hypothetical protein
MFEERLCYTDKITAWNMTLNRPLNVTRSLVFYCVVIAVCA